VLLPTLLQNPLLKSENGDIHGIQSGSRSALLKVDGKWYRAKGCGDLYGGFPLAPVDGHPELENIRGCTFEHTSARELKMSAVIQAALEPYGIPTCNKSVGLFFFYLPQLLGVSSFRILLMFFDDYRGF
jgi:hypothetical protein